MPKRAESPAKRPSGARPVPRRLFSFDSLRKEKTEDYNRNTGAPLPKTKLAEMPILEMPDRLSSESWTEKALVGSPDQEETKFLVSVPKSSRTRGKPPSLELEKSAEVLPTSDSTMTGSLPSSPSKRRWDTVRHHVLPSVDSSVDSLAETIPVPARPSTPKLYRFGQKKAFRHVVETAHTQQVGETKRFADTVRRACFECRFGETSSFAKPDREPTLGAVGSSLHLPFMMSTTSLQTQSNTASMSMQPAISRVGGIKRPQSMQSLAQSGRVPAPISRIARALASTMSLNRPTYLPHELLVLATLLTPFLLPQYGLQAENEQATAVETFEYIVRTWKASSTEVELERCLWCCKAGSVQSSSRARILGTLSSLLFSRDATFTAHTPGILQTLLQALMSLAYSLSLSSRSQPGAESVLGYLSAIRDGGCGSVAQNALEKEFGVRFSESDSETCIREILLTESVVRCLSSGPERARQWTLRTLLQEYWPMPDQKSTSTALLACAQWRKLKAVIPALRDVMATSVYDDNLDGDIILTIFQTRILPEVESVREEDSQGIRSEVVRLAFELLCKQHDYQRQSLLELLSDWFRSQSIWKASISNMLEELLNSEDWKTILNIIPPAMKELPDELQGPHVAVILPSLYNRLVVDPPPYPCPTLSHFLDITSRAYPKVFFKPLFACAAANKDVTVVRQLSILSSISKFLPDFWTRDPDMMSVAIISDIAGTRSTLDGESSNASRARIGQLVLTVELVERLQIIRGVKDLSVTTDLVKFAMAFEARLGSMIEVREKSSCIPESQRLILCVLFRQIRLLTRSLKPASWLDLALTWLQSWSKPTANQGQSREEDHMENEAVTTMHKLQAVYRDVHTRDGLISSGKRRSTMLSISFLERQASEQSVTNGEVEEIMNARLTLLSAASQSPKALYLELLVAMSGILTAEHYTRLGPILWNLCFLIPPVAIAAPLCFLLMQFAEKSPDDFTALVEKDFSSYDPVVRRRALERLVMLSTWRFQLLNQEVILDRAHRRPFKLQRPPVLFVATDIGSSLFVYEDDSDEYKDIQGHVIPAELRRRLSEIGWSQDDRVIDPRLQRIRTPMSLLPSQSLEKDDADTEDSSNGIDSQSPSPSPSPASSPAKPSSKRASIARQDSTGANRYGTRKRPVFVPALVSLFPKIASLANDVDFVVANTARHMIVDFMRDDPSILSRHVFQCITGDKESVIIAITAIKAFLHLKHVLPPAMAHHLLNHLTGFLKSAFRQAEGSDHLRSYAYSLHAIAKLVPQVSKVSIREIRRAKVDPLLIPSGSLWFPHTAPAGPLFPRSLVPSTNPFDTLPPSLVWITFIRTSQNMLFLTMLKRNPQDIKVIRKNMSALQLPSLSPQNDAASLSLKDMIPKRTTASLSPRSSTSISLMTISLTFARSHLLLVQQVFQCMSRHLNDRNELAVFLDGLNKILLAHQDDIGIVSHVMWAYMTASTRFRRLFISGGGYALFMPAVMKVFIEAEQQPSVRCAISYASERFYALHQDSFIFQTFDAMAQVIPHPASDGAWIASGMFTLLSSLKTGNLSSLPDAAGIHDLNKSQEQEALVVAMAEEVPQTFLASLRRNSETLDRGAVSLPVQDGYEVKLLKIHDLVRLLFTVVAHNPAIQRAEHFLRLLRLLTPDLFTASRQVQNALQTGIEALGGILLSKSSGKPKASDGHPGRASDQFDRDLLVEPSHGYQSSAPSNPLEMRLEYLALVVAFVGVSGNITTMTVTRLVELIKSILRDSRASANKVSAFFSDFMAALISRETSLPDVKDVIAFLEAFAPICNTHSQVLDLSGLFTVLHRLARNTVYSSDATFAKLIATRYCRIGLEVCEKVASEDLLFTSTLRLPLVNLLVDCVSMDGADVVSVLESRTLTHNLIAGIVMPATLMLRTSADIVADSQWAEGSRRDHYSKVWLRLLNLMISACDTNIPRKTHQKTSSLTQSPDHRKSSDQRSLTAPVPGPVKTFCIALQVLKIIVIRAEEDMSTVSPGIWVHLGNVLRSLLNDGNAIFAVASREYSEPPSPSLSPRTSTFAESQQSMIAFPSNTSIRRTLSPPRIIDYMTWSTIEWLWLRRSPLIIQMRIFAQERVANLAADLRLQVTMPGSLNSGPRAGGRRFSSVFSKPRRSMLALSASSSAASTPRNSMLINTSVSLPGLSSVPSTTPMLTPSRSVDSRQAGYARLSSPVSPSGRTSSDSLGVKIVHLGPTDSSTALLTQPRTSSPTSFASETRDRSPKVLAKETSVSSPTLIRMTYKRIRLVQHLMGYSNLLPMTGSDFMPDDGLDMGVKVWSRSDALRAVLDETKELLDEFRESFGDLGDESLVMVDSQQSLAPE